MNTRAATSPTGRPQQRSERGATATEYSLLVGFIALAILLGVGAFGGALDAVYDGFATFVTTTF